MVVAAAGAAAIGYWEDGALLIFIFALSGTLEGVASARTKKDITALMALAPDQASVLRGEREEQIAAASVVLGDRVRVRPGERIPADGLVIEGASAVNQASITGESMPVDKTRGRRGLRRHDQRTRRARSSRSPAARVTRCSPASSRSSRDAEARRPPAQLFIERFERGYAKVVVAGALAVTFVPWLAHWWTFRECALPGDDLPGRRVAVRAGRGDDAGAALGALQRRPPRHPVQGERRSSSSSAESRRSPSTRPGRSPAGHPVVTDVVPTPGCSADELLAKAAAVESLTDYPLGRAVIAEARRWELALPAARDLQAIVSVGAHAEVAGAAGTSARPSLFSSVQLALCSKSSSASRRPARR